jgi:hypothetical protein
VIGHYLLTLTPEQEDRVLTQTLGAGRTYRDPVTGARCILGAVHYGNGSAGGVEGYVRAWCDCRAWGLRQSPLEANPEPNLFSWPNVPMAYDRLVERFGAARIANAIRNRILSNRARRALTEEVHMTTA